MIIGADIPCCGYETLIRALLGLIADKPDVRLYLTGKRHRKEGFQLTNYCEALQILPRVTYLPYYDKLLHFPLLKRDCDLWVDKHTTLAELNSAFWGEQPKRVLFFTAFHPFKAEGNSVAMRFWIDRFKLLGYVVHLVWYMYDRNDVTEQMRRDAQTAFEHYVEIPVESLLTGINSNGLDVHTDDWCGPEVIETIRALTEEWSYDICFVNYTFFSAVFDACKPYSEKILFTHDSFAFRNKRMLEQGYKESGWMSLTEEGERLACSRAGKIICLQEEEGKYFAGISSPDKIYIIAPLPPVRTLAARPDVHLPLTVGYIGSHNYVNEYNLVELLEHIAADDFLRENLQFVIAGGASEHLSEFASPKLLQRVRLRLLGRVDSLETFYASCAIICNPERGGTGIKIKSLEALSYGAALLCTRAGAVGLGSSSPYHNLMSIADMPQAFHALCADPGRIARLRSDSVEIFKKLQQNLNTEVNMLLSPPKKYRTTPYIDKHARDYHFDAFSNIYSKLNIQDKTVMEIGSDHFLAMARLFAANGAKKVITCNFSSWSVTDEAPKNLQNVVGRFEDLNLEPQSVDIIFGIALLEHIPCFSEFIAKIKLLLKTDGYFYLQGEPLWTAPLGHHLYLLEKGTYNPRYSFDGKNPVPDWSHLVLKPEEMEKALAETVNNPAIHQEIVANIYDNTPYIGSNKIAPSEMLAMFRKDFYVEVDYSISKNPENIYYQQARKNFSEADLRCSGITIIGRAKKFIPKGVEGKRISVIIPCYNVEKYLTECIESVLAQTYQNLEIILVNDASLDSTSEVIERYAVQDSRVIPLHHSANLGLGPARNTGVAAATGDYLFFLDSDDYLNGPDALATLALLTAEKHCPVVIGSCQRLLLSGQLENFDAVQSTIWKGKQDSLYDGKDACYGAFLLPGSQQVPLRAWGTLFDAGFYKETGIIFPVGRHEDLPVVPFLYALAPSVWYSSHKAVVYRERADSLSNAVWDIAASADIAPMWAFTQENIYKAGVEERKTEIALRFLEHALYKIGTNSIHHSAVNALFCGAYSIAKDATTTVDQKYFNYIYSIVRQLYELDELSTGSTTRFQKIIKNFSQINMFRFYQNEEQTQTLPVSLAGRLIKDENPFLKTVMEEFTSRASDTTKNFPAMLTDGDRAVYFYYGRNHTFQGEIIDAGCFLGGTTQALLDGLAANPSSKGLRVPIRVFDLFAIDDNYIREWLEKIYHKKIPATEKSFRSYFDTHFTAQIARLDVHEGNIINIGYPTQKPIEFLGLDCCKTLPVMDSILRNFFPFLIPNVSIVVHQDYIHPYHPYIHISMELLRDYFEPILEIDGGGSYVWKCLKKITPQVIEEHFGIQSVTSFEEPSWYTDVRSNAVLLQKKQREMIYPMNKMILGFTLAVYYKNLGDEKKAYQTAREVRKIYPDLYMSDFLKAYMGVE